MASTKRIRGIPGNLALSYLSTFGFFDGGYMADWINYLARKNNIESIEIDILKKIVLPGHIAHAALLSDVEKLQRILKQELHNVGFEMSFIQTAVLKFEIPIHKPIERTIYCYPYLVDVDGKSYKPRRRIVDTAWEKDFPRIKIPADDPTLKRL